MKAFLRKNWYKLQDANRQRWSVRRYRRLCGGAPGSGLIGYTCFAGLANRLQAHVAALAIAHHSGLPVVPIWPRNAQCGATFDEIFVAQPAASETAQPSSALPRFESIALIPVSQDSPDRIAVQPGRLNLLDFRWQYEDSFRWIDEHGLRATVLDQLQFSPAVTARLAAQRATGGGLKIGVHIRRGDFVTHTPYARPTAAYTVQVRQMVEQLAANRPADESTIYLATDGGAAVCDELRRSLPEYRVVWNESNAERDSLDSIRDAVCDIVALADCEGLVLTGHSSFGKLARFFARRPQRVAVVD